ncbi:MAG: hypothetical protein ACREIP_11075, partial [Alphaproteobacteria bacterium]
VQCDRASKAMRIVPFAAANEECGRLRALKDAEWLVDVAMHVRAAGKERLGPGVPKVVKCDLGEGKSVWALVQGSTVNGNVTGRCGTVFTAVVTIEEQQPVGRRVLNDLNVLADCDSGGAADRIEYFIDRQELLVQWSSEPRFGTLERTVLARKYLSETARGGR